MTGRLGANPIEEIQDRFGYWGLRFVLLTLAVTPLRHVTGRNWLIRFRRMLGLFAFFYILMHFLTWLILDQSLLLSAIKEDIFERPFITLGFTAFLILIALAATSTNAMRRRLGRNWQKLHYGIYVVAILGVWHYWWQVKLDIRDPFIYAVILAVLFGYRIWWRHKYKRQA
ncbi:MAG: sulfite oxidase heme-binding subunit YedZ [Woeseia sp.]